MKSLCIRQKSYLISGAYLSKRSTLGRGLALNGWHRSIVTSSGIGPVSVTVVYLPYKDGVGGSLSVCLFYSALIFRKHCWRVYENLWICQVFTNMFFILCSYRWIILRTLSVSWNLYWWKSGVNKNCLYISNKYLSVRLSPDLIYRTSQQA